MARSRVDALRVVTPADQLSPAGDVPGTPDTPTPWDSRGGGAGGDHEGHTDPDTFSESRLAQSAPGRSAHDAELRAATTGSGPLADGDRPSRGASVSEATLTAAPNRANDATDASYGAGAAMMTVTRTGARGPSPSGTGARDSRQQRAASPTAPASRASNKPVSPNMSRRPGTRSPPRRLDAQSLELHVVGTAAGRSTTPSAGTVTEAGAETIITAERVPTSLAAEAAGASPFRSDAASSSTMSLPFPPRTASPKGHARPASPAALVEGAAGHDETTAPSADTEGGVDAGGSASAVSASGASASEGLAVLQDGSASSNDGTAGGRDEDGTGRAAVEAALALAEQASGVEGVPESPTTPPREPATVSVPALRRDASDSVLATLEVRPLPVAAGQRLRTEVPADGTTKRIVTHKLVLGEKLKGTVRDGEAFSSPSGVDPGTAHAARSSVGRGAASRDDDDDRGTTAAEPQSAARDGDVTAAVSLPLGLGSDGARSAPQLRHGRASSSSSIRNGDAAPKAVPASIAHRHLRTDSTLAVGTPSPGATPRRSPHADHTRFFDDGEVFDATARGTPSSIGNDSDRSHDAGVGEMKSQVSGTSPADGQHERSDVLVAEPVHVDGAVDENEELPATPAEFTRAEDVRQRAMLSAMKMPTALEVHGMDAGAAVVASASGIPGADRVGKVPAARVRRQAQQAAEHERAERARLMQEHLQQLREEQADAAMQVAHRRVRTVGAEGAIADGAAGAHDGEAVARAPAAGTAQGDGRDGQRQGGLMRHIAQLPVPGEARPATDGPRAGMGHKPAVTQVFTPSMIAAGARHPFEHGGAYGKPDSNAGEDKEAHGEAIPEDDLELAAPVQFRALHDEHTKLDRRAAADWRRRVRKAGGVVADVEAAVAEAATNSSADPREGVIASSPRVKPFWAPYAVMTVGEANERGTNTVGEHNESGQRATRRTRPSSARARMRSSKSAPDVRSSGASTARGSYGFLAVTRAQREKRYVPPADRDRPGVGRYNPNYSAVTRGSGPGNGRGTYFLPLPTAGRRPLPGWALFDDKADAANAAAKAKKAQLKAARDKNARNQMLRPPRRITPDRRAEGDGGAGSGTSRNRASRVLSAGHAENTQRLLERAKSAITRDSRQMIAKSKSLGYEATQAMLKTTLRHMAQTAKGDDDDGGSAGDADTGTAAGTRGTKAGAGAVSAWGLATREHPDADASLATNGVAVGGRTHRSTQRGTRRRKGSGVRHRRSRSRSPRKGPQPEPEPEGTELDRKVVQAQSPAKSTAKGAVGESTERGAAAAAAVAAGRTQRPASAPSRRATATDAVTSTFKNGAQTQRAGPSGPSSGTWPFKTKVDRTKPVGGHTAEPEFSDKMYDTAPARDFVGQRATMAIVDMNQQVGREKQFVAAGGGDLDDGGTGLLCYDTDKARQQFGPGRAEPTSGPPFHLRPARYAKAGNRTDTAAGVGEGVTTAAAAAALAKGRGSQTSSSGPRAAVKQNVVEGTGGRAIQLHSDADLQWDAAAPRVPLAPSAASTRGASASLARSSSGSRPTTAPHDVQSRFVETTGVEAVLTRGALVAAEANVGAADVRHEDVAASIDFIRQRPLESGPKWATAPARYAKRGNAFDVALKHIHAVEEAERRWTEERDERQRRERLQDAKMKRKMRARTSSHGGPGAAPTATDAPQQGGTAGAAAARTQEGRQDDPAAATSSTKPDAASTGAKGREGKGPVVRRSGGAKAVASVRAPVAVDPIARGLDFIGKRKSTALSWRDQPTRYGPRGNRTDSVVTTSDREAARKAANSRVRAPGSKPRPHSATARRERQQAPFFAAFTGDL